MTYVSYIVKALHPHRGRLALAAGGMCAGTLCGLIPPLILATIVDRVVGQSRYEWLVVLMLASLALPFVSSSVGMVSNYLVTLLAQRLIFDIRLNLYRHVHKLSCRYMQNTTTGKLLERLRGDVQQLLTLVSGRALGLLSQMLFAMIAVCVIVYVNWCLALVVVAALVLYTINYKWFVRRIRIAQRRYRRSMDQLSAMAQERLAGTAIVKAYGNERREVRSFTRQNFLTERQFHRFRMLNVTYGLTSSAIAWFAHAAIFFFGTYLVIRGHMTYGMVMATSSYAWMMLGPAIEIADLSNQIQQSKVAMDRIFELMREERDPVDEPGVKLQEIRGQVTFEDVSFSYTPNAPVLEDFSLTVKQGQTVALVGPTGCGKTTITNLLYRYYQPQTGRITIDGVGLHDLDTRWYRNRVAIVPQDPIVFDTTIAQNIAYGRPDADDAQIDRVARDVELGAVIDRFADGIHARIGDDGAKLSVGERQRLCIARALLADPAILIFDEATSSLDSLSESAIQRAAHRAMRGRTSFVIAHRLSTIVSADLIVVINHGGIVEQGTHRQLMSRRDGYYRRLYETQTGSIREAVPA